MLSISELDNMVANKQIEKIKRHKLNYDLDIKLDFKEPKKLIILGKEQSIKKKKIELVRDKSGTFYCINNCRQ